LDVGFGFALTQAELREAFLAVMDERGDEHLFIEVTGQGPRAHTWS
jgi:hypothetical protein